MVPMANKGNKLTVKERFAKTMAKHREAGAFVVSGMGTLGTGLVVGSAVGFVRGRYADRVTGDLNFPKSDIDVELVLGGLAGTAGLFLGKKHRHMARVALDTGNSLLSIQSCRFIERKTREAEAKK